MRSEADVDKDVQSALVEAMKGHGRELTQEQLNLFATIEEVFLDLDDEIDMGDGETMGISGRGQMTEAMSNRISMTGSQSSARVPHSRKPRAVRPHLHRIASLATLPERWGPIKSPNAGVKMWIKAWKQSQHNNTGRAKKSNVAMGRALTVSTERCF
jgi:hypothetical protein